MAGDYVKCLTDVQQRLKPRGSSFQKLQRQSPQFQKPQFQLIIPFQSCAVRPRADYYIQNVKQVNNVKRCNRGCRLLVECRPSLQCSLQTSSKHAISPTHNLIPISPVDYKHAYMQPILGSTLELTREIC